MIRYIQHSMRFIKQYNRMLRSGSKAVKAAGKADQIIESLKTNRKDFHSLGRLTKHGELRIKNCIKYDLGNGYRIVFQLQKDHLHVMFIGTHAESDKWLDTRRSLKKLGGGQTMEDACMTDLLVMETTGLCHTGDKEEFSLSSQKEIEDKYLRQVFRGLCTPLLNP